MVEGRFSTERLGPYRALLDDDLRQALALYKWNADISAAFWPLIGYLEVVLRNAMHEQLTTWSSRTCDDPRWYLHMEQILTARGCADITEARRRATSAGRQETASRVIAELPLGFWRYLLAGKYERVLWFPALRNAFPGMQGRGIRRDLFDDVSRLHLLRNRIAHHEPVHDWSLDEAYVVALRTVGWICPVTRSWIEARSMIPATLSRHPCRG